MRRTAALGADFWNDSCALKELGEAVENGAVGATSNPVIVGAAVEGEPETWLPVLDGLIRDRPGETEDELAWRLTAEIGERAAKLLAPVCERTGGRKGFLSMQVSPKLYGSAAKMIGHARVLAAVAPNVAIKVPAVGPGFAAMEELTAEGINVNATVSFSVAQAAASAEAFERGLRRAAALGLDPVRLHPYVTIMVGRVDDHLKRTAPEGGPPPEVLDRGGIAVFKRARALFREKGWRASLLAAAYRHEGHWSELIGEGVVLSMPYKWWKRFEDSGTEPRASLDEPVEEGVLDELRRHPEFRRLHEPDGMRPEEFLRCGASVHTLNQFLEGYEKLVRIVRARMLGRS